MKEDKVIQITEAISKLDESDKYRLFVGLFFKKIILFDKEFRTNKTAYTLIKSGVFKSTVIEKEFIKRIEESGYSEDENGFPISTSKKKEV